MYFTISDRDSELSYSHELSLMAYWAWLPGVSCSSVVEHPAEHSSYRMTIVGVWENSDLILFPSMSV